MNQPNQTSLPENLQERNSLHKSQTGNAEEIKQEEKKGKKHAFSSMQNTPERNQKKEENEFNERQKTDKERSKSALPVKKEEDSAYKIVKINGMKIKIKKEETTQSKQNIQTRSFKSKEKSKEERKDSSINNSKAVHSTEVKKSLKMIFQLS